MNQDHNNKDMNKDSSMEDKGSQSTSELQQDDSKESDQ